MGACPVGLAGGARPGAPAARATTPPATQPATAHQDPTQVNPKLRQFLVSGGAATTKAQARPTLGKITRRAFIEAEHHEPEALISVAGDAALLPISAGSTLTIPSARGQTVTIHVTKLSAEAIEIEVPATGEKVTVR